ncbi:MAG: ATP-dependent DNA helicase [Spirochaetia bacterium]|nr:ATP-dependent DNA helicase [Spirochaetia bacterium]
MNTLDFEDNIIRDRDKTGSKNPVKNPEKFQNAIYPPWFKISNHDVDSVQESDLNQIIESAFNIISQKYPDYQSRPDQIEMSKNILKNLMNQSIYIVEAGTGIGKSFAYLIAVIAYSYLSGDRVVITTETKNLQMQIFKKDLPSLEKLLAPKLSFEIALGSSNYFCRLRNDEVFNEGKFRDIISESELERYKTWTSEVIAGKVHGHMFDMEKPFPDDFWRQIGRDPDGCPGNKCLYFSSCNYYKAKADWNNSRIIIANHHLFLYNIFNEKRTLPSYSGVVFDEAHGLIQSGQSILTHKFSTETIRDLNKRFETKLRKSLPQEAYEEWSENWKNLELSWHVFFSSWEVQLAMNFEENSRKIILEKQNIDIKECLFLLEKICNDISEYIQDEEDSSILNVLNAILKALKKAVVFCQYYQIMNTEKMVYWGEKIDNRFYLFACNLNLGDELSPHLTEGQVWTSATLGYWPFDKRPANKEALLKGGYFKDFTSEALGDILMNEAKVDYFGSPFNYAKQAVLYIPDHLAAPAWGASGGAQELYERNLMDEVIELIRMSNGGALVLFTSNYQLNQAGKIIREKLDLEVFSQLELGAEGALKKFKATPDSVLLGTNSYWQGIDVTGRQLRALIITKMMFTPPSDPVLQARSKILEKKNQNPFMKISLPKSCMMLRQAFGRLIRSENDTGFVAILDSRIHQKAYGKLVLVNLPEIPLVKKLNDLRDLILKNNLV